MVVIVRTFLLALALISIAACGGGSTGDTNESPDESSVPKNPEPPAPEPPNQAIEVDVLFPIQSALTYEASVSISGSVLAPDKSGNASIEILNSANQVIAATVGVQGDWRVEVPLVQGDNVLTVIAKNGVHVEGEINLSIERSVPRIFPQGPLFDALSNSVLLADRARFVNSSGGIGITAGSGRLVEVDLSTRIRSILSGPSFGSGPTLESPLLQVLDLRADRVLVYDTFKDAIVSVDRKTGNRSLLVDVAASAQLETVSIRGMWLDEQSYRLLLILPFDGVWEVRLNSLAVNKLFDFDAYEYGFVDQGMYAPNSVTNSVFFVTEERNGPIKLYSLDMFTNQASEHLPALTAANGSGDSIDLEEYSAVTVNEQTQTLYVAGFRRTSGPVCNCFSPVIVEIDLQTGEFSDLVAFPDDTGYIHGLDAGVGSTLYATFSEQDRLIEIDTGNGSYKEISDTSRGIMRSEDETGVLVFDEYRGRLFTEAKNRFSESRIQQVNLVSGARPDYFVTWQFTGGRPSLRGGATFSEAGELIWSSGSMLYKADLLTEEPELVAEFEVLSISGMCLRTSDNTLFVALYLEDSLVAIDLDSKSVRTVGELPENSGLQNLQCDGANNRIVAYRGLDDAIVAMSMVNAELVELSSPNIGGGIDLDDFRGMALSPDKRFVFGAQASGERVVRIDLQSGSRTDFYSDVAGKGPPLGWPNDVVFVNEKTILVHDTGKYNRILAIDTETGEAVVQSY